MSRTLSSWSRRRAAVAAEAAAEEQALQDEAVLAEQAELTEKSDEEILDELGLPDPDSLVQGDDFKVFLSKAVPQHLRQRALRNLWRSNPVLACVDGLNDYDDDYLTAGLGQGAIKTTYQVGKGMLSHLLEVERQKSEDLELAKPESIENVADVADIALETPDEVVHTASEHGDMNEADQEPTSYTPRRMQFQFENENA